MKVTQLCPTLCDPWTTNPGMGPGSPALQANSLWTELRGKPKIYIQTIYKLYTIYCTQYINMYTKYMCTYKVGTHETNLERPHMLSKHCLQTWPKNPQKWKPELASIFCCPCTHCSSPVLSMGYSFWTSWRPYRRLSTEELRLLNCSAGEDTWESLGLQGDQISQS